MNKIMVRLMVTLKDPIHIPTDLNLVLDCQCASLKDSAREYEAIPGQKVKVFWEEGR